MLTQAEMSTGDFQKLLRIALNDLTIQRTLLENEMAQEADDLRTLERDDNVATLDRRIMLIQRDYDHYKQFLDPDYHDTLPQY
ncbi:MAG: hypothetical protein LKJ69_05595 [Lactobacillus sp.]|jgi:hypothetical protein|nr:hypothetical protein [Lactobacillus sp.]MCI2032860.1 hypothetical protein [Lactobacillus sp.]